MSTLLNIGDKIKAIFTPGIIADRFVLLVDSAETGTSNDNQFTLTGAEVSEGTTFPVTYAPKDAPYSQTEVTLDVSDPTITFPSEGEYYVQAGQPFNRIAFDNAGDKDKVLEIRQWGGIEWSSMEDSFRGCSNMFGNATDAPDLSGVTVMSSMFRNSLFNQDIGNWDVSSVEKMNNMFNNTTFNQPIGDWDVSNVNEMAGMFFNSPFNQDIGNWDVSNVTNMAGMFRESSFNQDIGGWDVENLDNASRMFQDSPFNQYIGNWEIINITRVDNTFNGSSMSCENYTDTLVGWANFVEDNGVPLNVNATGQSGMTFATSRDGGANFANAGEARTEATKSTGDDGLGWSISGDSVQTNC